MTSLSPIADAADADAKADTDVDAEPSIWQGQGE